MRVAECFGNNVMLTLHLQPVIKVYQGPFKCQQHVFILTQNLLSVIVDRKISNSCTDRSEYLSNIQLFKDVNFLYIVLKPIEF